MTDLLKLRERLEDLQPTQINWLKMEELVASLESVHFLALQLQREDITAGDFLVHLHSCNYKLSRVHKKNTAFVGAAMDMLSALKERLSVVLDTPN